MTRRDYILLARVFRRLYEAKLVGGPFWEIVAQVAEALGEDNPRFDRAHFYAVIRGEKELESRPARAGA